MRLTMGSSEDGEFSYIWTYDGGAVSGASITLRWRLPRFDIVETC